MERIEEIVSVDVETGLFAQSFCEVLKMSDDSAGVMLTDSFGEALNCTCELSEVGI